MQNLLARTKGSSRWLGLCLFAIAFLCAALISGCGSSGSSGGGGTSDSASSKGTTDVIFHFNESSSAKILARAIPQGTTHIRFTGNDSSRNKLYGPTEKAYASTITLNNVPVSVTGFVLECIKKDGKNVELTAIVPVDKVSLTEDKEKHVIISDSYVKPLIEVVKSVTNTPSEFNPFAIGMSESFTVIATLEGGQTVALTPYLTFTSSDPKVATVEQNGFDGAKVVAQGGGTATISGEVLGVEMPNITVTVDPKMAVDGIVFCKSGKEIGKGSDGKYEPLKVAPGFSDSFIVKIHYNNGTEKDFASNQASCKIKPDDLAKAEVIKSDKITDIRVTGLEKAKVGEKATITVTATLDGNSYSQTIDVVIIDAVPTKLTITDVTERALWPAEVKEQLGDNGIYTHNQYSFAQFKAELEMSDGSAPIDVTDNVTWNSSNENAAKFDEVSAGKLQGNEIDADTLTTTVKAYYSGLESYNKIDIEVKKAGIIKLEVVKGLTEGGELNLILPYKDKGAKPETTLKLVATYGNDDTEDPIIKEGEDGLTCEHLIHTGKDKATNYLDFENVDDQPGSIKVTAKESTSSLDASYVRFTYKNKSTTIKDEVTGKDKDIPANVTKGYITDVSMSLVDNETKHVYDVDAKDSNDELGVPFGRDYKVYITGQSKVMEDGKEKDGPLVDVSDEYYYGFYDSYGNFDADPNTTSTSLVTSADATNPVIVSGVSTTPEQHEGWSENGNIVSIKDGYDPSKFDFTATERGKHKYTAGNGEIVLLAKNRESNQVVFRVKLYLAEPAVNSYKVYSYKGISRRGNEVTFDIPRGTKIRLNDNHVVMGVMSDKGPGGSNREEDITDKMTIDDASVTRDKFIISGDAGVGYQSVDSTEQYSGKNDYNGLESERQFEVTINNKWDEEGNFGHKTLSGWFSYNCDIPKFIFRLERPIVTGTAVVLDEEKNPVPEDAADKKYHFKQGDIFYYYLSSPVFSDNQNSEYVATKETISQRLIPDPTDPEHLENGTMVKAIERTKANAASDDPYRMRTTTDEPKLSNGFSSTIKLEADRDKYYDSGALDTSATFVLDIP